MTAKLEIVHDKYYFIFQDINTEDLRRDIWTEDALYVDVRGCWSHQGVKCRRFTTTEGEDVAGATKTYVLEYDHAIGHPGNSIGDKF